MIKKIKKYFNNIKKQVNFFIIQYKKKFGYTEKISINILLIIILEITTLTPFYIIENIENQKKIDKIKILKDLNNSISEIKIDNTIKNVDIIISRYDLYDVFITRENNEINESKDNLNNKYFEKYIEIYNNVNRKSFDTYIEPKLVDNNISYKFSLPKNEIKYPFTHFIIEHILQIAILILFLFMFEKQGLLGNKNKYEILKPENIKDNIDSLIGMEDIKKEIYILADLIRHKEKYKEFGIEDGFNYLFVGPPGTGKTKIASLLAKMLNVPIVVGTGNIETGFINGGVTVLQNLFKTAEKEAMLSESKVCLIFLDEAQTLLYKRGEHKEKWADDSSNELLDLLDGVKTNKEITLIFIAASNFDEKNNEFDEAMMRRFKKKIYFRLPNLEERKNILEFYLSKIDKKYIADDIDLLHIADITSGLSPALIETIVQEASLLLISKEKDMIFYEMERYKKLNLNELEKLDINKIEELFKNMSNDEILDLLNIKYNKKDSLNNYLEKTKIDKITTKLLEKSFERITVGMTDRKTTDKKEKERKIISLHELGHFIIEYYIQKELFKKEYNKNKNLDLSDFLKENLKTLKISTEAVAQINALGYVLSKDNESLLHSKKDLENIILTLYGGVASEEYFYGEENITTGSYNDIEKITNILNNMIFKLGMYSNSKINMNMLNNENLNNMNNELLLKKSKELFEKSKKIIKMNNELIIYLNRILLKEYVINKEDLIEYIVEYEKGKDNE